MLNNFTTKNPIISLFIIFCFTFVLPLYFFDISFQTDDFLFFYQVNFQQLSVFEFYEFKRSYVQGLVLYYIYYLLGIFYPFQIVTGIVAIFYVIHFLLAVLVFKFFKIGLKYVDLNMSENLIHRLAFMIAGLSLVQTAALEIYSGFPLLIRMWGGGFILLNLIVKISFLRKPHDYKSALIKLLLSVLLFLCAISFYESNILFLALGFSLLFNASSKTKGLFFLLAESFIVVSVVASKLYFSTFNNLEVKGVTLELYDFVYHFLLNSTAIFVPNKNGYIFLTTLPITLILATALGFVLHAIITKKLDKKVTTSLGITVLFLSLSVAGISLHVFGPRMLYPFLPFVYFVICMGLQQKTIGRNLYGLLIFCSVIVIWQNFSILQKRSDLVMNVNHAYVKAVELNKKKVVIQNYNSVLYRHLLPSYVVDFMSYYHRYPANDIQIVKQYSFGTNKDNLSLIQKMKAVFKEQLLEKKAVISLE